MRGPHDECILILRQAWGTTRDLWRCAAAGSTQSCQHQGAMHPCWTGTAWRGRLRCGLCVCAYLARGLRGGEDDVDEFVYASMWIRGRPQLMLARVGVRRDDCPRHRQGRTLHDRNRQSLGAYPCSPNDIRPPDTSSSYTRFPTGILARVPRGEYHRANELSQEGRSHVRGPGKRRQAPQSPISLCGGEEAYAYCQCQPDPVDVARS